MRYLDKLEEAKVDRGLTRAQKIAARIQRGNDAPDELAQKTRTGPVGDMARSKAQRWARLRIARAENASPEKKKAKTFAKNREREAALKNLKASNKFYGRKVDHTSYQQIGGVLAEAMLGKIRSKAADKLGDISRDQYRRGEVDDASGKPTRASIRAKAAHLAGKLAQKVRPKDKG